MASWKFGMSAVILSNLTQSDSAVRPPYVFWAAQVGVSEANFWNKVAWKRDTVWSIYVIWSSMTCTHALAKCCSSVLLHSLPHLMVLVASLISRTTWAEGIAKKFGNKVWCRPWHKPWCSAIIMATWETTVPWRRPIIIDTILRNKSHFESHLIKFRPLFPHILEFEEKQNQIFQICSSIYRKTAPLILLSCIYFHK